MNDRDLDAEFERIVAGWDTEAPDPQPRRGAATDGSSDTGGDEAASPQAPQPSDPTAPAEAADALGTAPTATPSPTASPSPSSPPSDAGRPAPEARRGDAPDPGATASGAVGPTAPRTPQPEPPAPGGDGGLGLPIAPGAGHVWRGHQPPGDDDAVLDLVDDDRQGEHFVPPTETDLPTAEDDPMFWAIVGGLVGGPLLLLWVVIFDRGGSGWWLVTSLTMIVIGFVLLVLRGGTERDPFDDGTRL